MNCLVLSGPLLGRPLLAETGSGALVATVHLRVPCACGKPVRPTGGYEIPCLVPRNWLPELLRWQEQGFHLRLEGHLHREILWYEGGGVRTVQVWASTLTCIEPRTGRPTGALLTEAR